MADEKTEQTYRVLIESWIKAETPGEAAQLAHDSLARLFKKGEVIHFRVEPTQPIPTVVAKLSAPVHVMVKPDAS